MEQFSKDQRLLTRLDFSRVFQRSKKIQNRYFRLFIHYKKSSETEKSPLIPRLGLVISKKVDKRAVQRNRVKRLVRESFRIQQNLKNADYIVLAKPGCGTASNHDLLANLNHLWLQTEKNK